MKKPHIIILIENGVVAGAYLSGEQHVWGITQPEVLIVDTDSDHGESTITIFLEPFEDAPLVVRRAME